MAMLVGSYLMMGGLIWSSGVIKSKIVLKMYLCILYLKTE